LAPRAVNREDPRGSRSPVARLFAVSVSIGGCGSDSLEWLRPLLSSIDQWMSIGERTAEPLRAAIIDFSQTP
jgi:hypothetical protein